MLAETNKKPGRVRSSEECHTLENAFHDEDKSQTIQMKKILEWP